MQPHPGEEQDRDSRPRVCRRLFADDEEDANRPDDGVRDNVLNQINEQISRDLDDASKKYNFDFRSEQPLEGDWQWERIVSHPSERRPADVDNLEVPPPESSPAAHGSPEPLVDPPAPSQTPQDPLSTGCPDIEVPYKVLGH